MAGSWIFYTTFPKIPLINPEFKNIAQFAPPLGFLIGTIQSYIFLLIFIAYQIVSITSQAILIKFLILILIGIFLSYCIPNILGNKIGGFNGDACGASVVLVETAMLFMHAILL